MTEIKSNQRREFFKTAFVGSVAIGGLGFWRNSGANTPGPDWITVTATITLDPEKADKAIAALKKLVAGVKEKEPGVVAYICNRSLSNPNEIMFFEIYENAEATRIHGKTDHMREFQASASDYLVGKMKVAPYSQVAGFHR